MSNIALQPIELRKQRDFSECISTGFQFVRQNWKSLYRPLIFICMPLHLVGALLMGTFFRTMVPGRLPGRLPGALGSMFGGYTIMGISFLLLYVVVFEYMRLYMENNGRQPSFGDIWARTRQQFFAYFAIGLLAGIMAMLGLVLLIIPGVFLMITFAASFPLRAFERTSVGDSIGQSFSLVWGNWWLTFALIIVMAMLVSMMSYVIIIPFALIAGLGLFSGIFTQNPTDVGSSLGLMMTLYMVLVGVVTVLFQPFFLVTIGTHILSLIEGKKATGLMQQVESMDLGNRTSPPAGNV